jgi:hypothetical protein
MVCKEKMLDLQLKHREISRSVKREDNWQAFKKRTKLLWSYLTIVSHISLGVGTKGAPKK